MNKISDYENIIEVAHTETTEKANSYLALGWVMLNIESNQYSEHSWSTTYILGWNKSKNQIQYPEKTEWEKISDKVAKDESIPF